MKADAKVGNFNFFNEIDGVFLDELSKIGRENWITGLSSDSELNFTYSPERECIIRVGRHARITNAHYFDCTGGIHIGDFSTVAGIRSVIFTHSIDINVSRQTAGPVIVGKFCIVSTNCKLLKGAELPDFSVLGAGAVLNKRYEEPYGLFGGTPARRLKTFDANAKYFKREIGHVT